VQNLNCRSNNQRPSYLARALNFLSMKKILFLFAIAFSLNLSSQVIVEKHKDFLIGKSKLRYRKNESDSVRLVVSNSLGCIKLESNFLPKYLGDSLYYSIYKTEATDMYDMYVVIGKDNKDYVIYFEKNLNLIYIYDYKKREYYSIYGTNISYEIIS
jgi:hypothetical protein